MTLLWLFFLLEHLYLSGMWFWCGSKNGYLKDTCLKEIGVCEQNMLTIFGWESTRWRRPTRRFNMHTFFFTLWYVIHIYMSSNNCEKNRVTINKSRWIRGFNPKPTFMILNTKSSMFFWYLNYHTQSQVVSRY